jgi:AAHS family 4-hydroxybenzoate transporter-like MFS transporter
MAEAVGISRVIDERPLSALQLRVIILCSLAAFVDGYDLQAMAVALPNLAEEWGLAPAVFKFAQSASLVGMAIGSVFLGPLGDRFGRKPIMISGLIFMGGSSLGVILSEDPNHLAFWRTLVGIGYGMIHGNATALTAEYAPLRQRAMLMTLMGCNVAFGGLMAGLTAQWILPALGWEGIFIVGGIAPVVLAVLMLAMPDSLQIMHARRHDDPRIARIVDRIAPGIDVAQFKPAANAVKVKLGGSVLDLLRPPLLERTLSLWLIYGFNTFLLYLLISWLPVLLGEAGWTREASLQGIVLFQLGGIVGAILLSLLVDRGRAVQALIIAYSVGAVAAVLFVVLPPTGVLWSGLILILGAGVSGAMFALMALGAIFYPPTVRAAGFSWNAAVSRLGAVLGPLVGGWVLGRNVPASEIIGWLAVPAGLSALIALGLRGVMRRIQ